MKKSIFIMLIMALILSMSCGICAAEPWDGTVAESYAKGDGTYANPYVIETPAQLALLSQKVNLTKVKGGSNYANCYFELANNIDFGCSVNEDGTVNGSVFTPIGTTDSLSFAGNFDGKGHTISGLVVQSAKADTAIGFFGYTGASGKEARILNLTLKDSTLLRFDKKDIFSGAGLLVGCASNTSIYNCHVEGGKVNTPIQINAGGLVGQLKTDSSLPFVEISGCSSTADVIGASPSGGLIGRVRAGTSAVGGNGVLYIRDCYATGDVTAPSLVGGLIGEALRLKEISLENCYASGNLNVANGSAIGGLVGNVTYGAGTEPVQNLRISHCAALMDAITVTNTKDMDTSLVSRLVGSGEGMLKYGTLVFDKNYGLDTMALNGSKLIGQDENGTNGLDKSKEDFSLKSTWESLNFDFSEESSWQWSDSEKMPRSSNVSAGYKIYISTQPHDATAYKNKPAKFYVVSSRGVEPHSYQWQNSNNGQSWSDIAGEENSSLEVAGSILTNGKYYRCVITDGAGQQVFSDAAKLTYVKVDFTTDVAVSSLLEYYKNTGNPQTMGAYTGIRAATTATEDYAYNAGTKAEYPETRDGWYLLDLMSRNIDPRNVYLTDISTGDYIDALLGMQQTDGGFTDNKYDGLKRYAVEYVLALDIYFDGASTWGNEAEGTSLGRDGAIRWILDQVAEVSLGQKAYGGKYVAMKYGRDMDAYYHQQCGFIMLMARLADDPVYGSEAKDALFDILPFLRDAYSEGTLTRCTNTTAVYADYASALTAAANSTSNFLKKYELNNEAAAVCEKLYTALAQDGSYSAKMDRNVPDATGDALATSYVLMALADVSNGSCYLAEAMNHTPDKAYIDRALRDVVIPEIAYEDLALAKEGLYGVTFSWSSSNPQVLHNDGTLSRAAEDKKVVLTVTAAYGDTSITKEYTVLVPAATALGADDTHRDLESLSFYPEYISDFELPTEGKYGSTITWASSAPEVISGEGKVVRPAIGEKDATVTLTATATKGDSSESKEFTVLVYAAQDVTKNEGQIKEFNYQTRQYYLKNRVLWGYWDVWAAYAALGEYIQDPANGYTYDTTPNSASQPGAHILALVAMGENPYNYYGKDLVAEMIDGGVTGPWSVPVFNSLGLYAVGSDYDAIPYAAACGWMRNLSMGPDIGGWACAVAAYNLDNGQIQDSIAYFKDVLKDDMASGSTGSKELSMGCVLTGFGAFMGAGLSGYDVTKDSPWVEQDPVGKIYSNNFGTSELAGFSTQPMMEMSDLYNVMYQNRQIGWIQCGVSKAKLDAQIEKANAILADESKYEAASVQTVKEALEVVKGISEDRLNAKTANYGKEYYTLYDAVRYAKLAGQSEMDQAVADKVADQINALNDEITLADKEAVEAAKAAYDALTNDQKALIAEDVKAKLTAAVDTIASLEQAEVDKEAAANVINEINKINEKVTLDDQSAVAAARAAYDALTKEQKALVTNLDKLTKAEGTIKELLEKDNGKVKNMTDVIEGQWYYDDVAYALDNNIFKGTSDTTFSPNQAMTRAMFVTVLGRNAGVEDSSASYPSTSVFDDVANDAYYASHVKWAVENGITVGVSKTEFAPNAQISRQDMATMMLRYAKAMGIQLPEMSKEAFADDVDIANYAKEAVYKLKAVEIINGKDGNVFDPKGSTTRAEVAAVLHRFLTYKYEDFVKVDDTGCVIVDIEKFTLGQGFIMEPVVVKWEEGDTAADVTIRAAEQAGIELQYGDTDMGFYLSAIRDNETAAANIPQYLKDAAEENGFTIGERANADWLSQFDYTSESGWMIWVNHEEISRSAGAWDVTPGTVIRWQFTVCGLGKDLGSGTYGTPYVTVGKKDALVHAMAVASKHEKAGEAYKNAMKVMEKMDATQAEINSATDALND